MHDAGKAGGRPVFGDEAEQVGPGVGWLVLGFGGWDGQLAGAAVDRDGLACGGGDLELGDEGGVLRGDIGVVEVVVVEADFADGDAAWVGGKFFQFGEVFGGGLVGFLGVDAGGGVDLGVLVGEVEGYVHVVGAVTDADGEELVDAGRVGIGEDRGQVFVVVEMAVRIDKHRGRV